MNCPLCATETELGIPDSSQAGSKCGILNAARLSGTLTTCATAEAAFCGAG
ncbi:hypothetical protein CLOSTMETH_01464 [[Clostridium] methylpentosum DSM 5476]|uniref:Uncharacterized protein n=1 Tax=[Clostridium] methylpentosum DSM 5476 TaxID=537013 RepID=C0EC95_9FIRM|nr:hypothetical protein CLOSTMETH_01464 [[Clostridium] methylpentosum DSM 5476]MDY3989556.1 hypothetical protein [Massilioclostridium sp.]MEE1491382.1 hypothetical protein [Massilioclostridium sp.]